jgi:hypothetical protein
MLKHVYERACGEAGRPIPQGGLKANYFYK